MLWEAQFYLCVGKTGLSCIQLKIGVTATQPWCKRKRSPYLDSTAAVPMDLLESVLPISDVSSLGLVQAFLRTGLGSGTSARFQPHLPLPGSLPTCLPPPLSPPWLFFLAHCRGAFCSDSLQQVNPSFDFEGQFQNACYDTFFLCSLVDFQSLWSLYMSHLPIGPWSCGCTRNIREIT